jgi:predicted dehydrogenase
MKKIKLGIIGAGGIAMGIHLPVLAAIPEAELCAVCDLVSRRAKEAARIFGIGRTYLSYHDMLENEKLNAVFVLVPPDGLFRVSSDCLLAGVHVFMEKPMGITLFQAGSLKDIAASQKRILHVGFNRRFIPLVREITCRFRELTFLTHIEGRFYKNSSPSFYGGCASSFVCDVIHVIDLIRHIAAGGPNYSPVVRASTLERKNPETGIAEAWFSSMEFENGVSALVRADYRTGGRVHQFELHGPGASAFIDLGFGREGCSGKILHSTGAGTHSISAAGANGQEIIEFDGIKLAKSDKYEIYYGYGKEDRHFIQTVLDDPEGTDSSRTAEDYASMELVEQLLNARVWTYMTSQSA